MVLNKYGKDTPNVLMRVLCLLSIFIFVLESRCTPRTDGHPVHYTPHYNLSFTENLNISAYTLHRVPKPATSYSDHLYSNKEDVWF